MNTQLTLHLNPHGTTPLSAVCRISPKLERQSTLRCIGGGATLNIELPAGTSSCPLLGLRADTNYRVSIEEASVASVANSPSFKTPPLPAALPAMQVRLCHVEEREKGYTLFALGKNPKAIQKYTEYECIIALDREGQIAWLYQSQVSIMGVEPTARGTLLLMTTDGRIQEIDWLGALIREWHNPGEFAAASPTSIPVHTPKFHHAVCELPDGWIAALSVEFREVDGFPHPGQAQDGKSYRQRVAADTIVEFHPDTGEIRKELRLLDVLDPRRMGHHVMGPFWDNQGYPGCRDWSHANSICYDAEHDAYITTLRHQDLCCRIGRDGGIHWLLAPSEGWDPAWSTKVLSGVSRPPFHPHDPTLLPNGDVMLFDNGNIRATPPAQPLPIESCYSRVVRYRIDEGQNSAEVVWSLDGALGELPYSAYMSGARLLPTTQNVLVTCGGILTLKGGGRTDVPPEGIGSVCILEVSQTSPARRLFEFWIERKDSTDSHGWAAFRSVHVPDLYCGSTAVERLFIQGDKS